MHLPETSSYLVLLGLGAFHGVNPGMGWLFAVALGLQEGRRRAVWGALGPLALGHLLAVGVVVGAAALTGIVLPPRVVSWTVAAALVALGLRRLVRHRHPRFGGMRVGPLGLTVWSGLMATAHGAGLMVLPVVLGMSADASAGPMCHTAAASAGAGPAAAAALVHGAGYLVATALIAVVVFERVGLGVLRRAWVNLDLIWAGALIVTGVITAFL
jgi:hypothetical protein